MSSENSGDSKADTRANKGVAGPNDADPKTLPDLLAYIAKQKAEKRAAPEAFRDPAVVNTCKQTSAARNAPWQSPLGEPPEVEYFQQTWQKLSTGLRLKQSAQQVPENAGPLNSTQLIHRALLQMQETSPEYLQHFLSYLDTLSWMEQLHAANLSSLERALSKPASSSAKTQNKPSPSTAAKRPAKNSNKRLTSR